MDIIMALETIENSTARLGIRMTAKQPTLTPTVNAGAVMMLVSTNGLCKIYPAIKMGLFIRNKP
jgi:hypothetical protein